jgi:HKD family nuclease
MRTAVEFLADADKLRLRFTKLLATAETIDIAVAWAGNPRTGVQSLLWKARRKVRRLVVGCTLFNTHPAFLERWQNHARFRVVLDTGEVFHPKLYLFRGRHRIHLLVGSSNLTDGGFEKNREANVLLQASGERAGPVAAGADYINARYVQASIPRGPQWEKWLASYRSSWKSKPRPGAKPPAKARGKKGPRVSGRQLEDLEILSFADYFRRLRKGNRATATPLSAWLDFLEDVRKRWAAAGWALRQMPIQGRRLIAGEHHADAEGAGLFGFMGLGHFLHAAIHDPLDIDRALREIPRKGDVRDSHWAAFRRAYSRAFPKAAVGSASRLLSLWRPDVFFSANDGSIPEVAPRLGLPQAALRDWAGYWEATKWIAQRPWARTGVRKTRLAERCWRGRVALLDVLMYRPAR